MSVVGPRDGLSLDQAPPLSIPASFFLLAPVALLLGGGLLLVQGAAPLSSGSRPGSLALAHLGTLGFLGSVMLGALYQMAPVVAGAPVPMVRLGYAVHAGWSVGLILLVAGFLTGRPALYEGAGLLLGGALLLFVAPLTAGLWRVPAVAGPVHGMRIAVLSLGLVGLLGLGFVSLRAGHPTVTTLPGFELGRWRLAHFGLGLVGWVGALIAAVSWQVLPMFYLAPEVPKRLQWAVSGLAGITFVALVASLAADGRWVLWALVPGGLAAWAIHPALSLPRLLKRQRKRRDETVRGWMASLACAPAVGLLAVAAAVLPDPRWGVAFVWLAVVGWAGLAIHGMLCRIVPFLVWFHRLSPLVGQVAVPPVRRLMPQDRIRNALGAHAVALLLGVLAIGTGWPIAGRAAGLALVVTAALLGRNLVDVLRFRPEV